MVQIHLVIGIDDPENNISISKVSTRGDVENKMLLDTLRYLPDDILVKVDRAAIPLNVWLRGPLRDWAEGLLHSDRIKKEGYLNSHLVVKKWKEYLSGQNNLQYQLWNILMFQAWLENETL